ncbi:MAG: hypothetical protein HN919_09385 [Verrucomicrobia bacterium]|jgi:hypothetical protein|nr:hypothetical protein [Verrucomicrobiota bacterium]MBT7066501.1 hypothetical protein [Verrucomicrobiota bacterium]MBT7699951.1 hypothetical protein [Verrucomicrobiota bacterium]
MAADFFDEDLVDVDPQAPGAAPTPVSPAAATGPISGAGQLRMNRQKEELTTQVADAVKEIEELRMKQEHLEKERGDLQELARRQDSYEDDKVEIMDQLARSIMHLEKDEAQANRFAELMSVMRDRFKDTHEELRGINEAGWAKDVFQTELNKGVVLVEEARSIYRKGIAKIDAENWNQIHSGAAQPTTLVRGEMPGGLPRRFSFWFKAGLAFTVPIIVISLLVFGVAIILRLNGWY